MKYLSIDLLTRCGHPWKVSDFENLSWANCGRKFDSLPKLVQHWEKQYEVSRLRAELS